MFRLKAILAVQLILAFYVCSTVAVTVVDSPKGTKRIKNREFSDEIDWTDHPCHRNCTDDAPPMECYYTFRVESYYAMSKACFQCPFSNEDCFRMHCIPVDGIKRSLTVVNRLLPGPSIEVCQGDRVIVDVTNMMPSESTTMHWHGQHHIGTPYMDGVPYVTQCPILPGSTFRYNFIAATAGTHFWHSHSGMQRSDGVFGPFVVRVPPKKNRHADLYDFDQHNMVITDWGHEMGIDKFLLHHHSDGDNKGRNLLVNGLGRFKPFSRENGTLVDMPLATFNVKQNFRYRFRLINSGFLNCPIEVSVDNHTMYVVSTDGNDIEPIEAGSLVSYAGERFDFIIEMDQEIDNYWIRFRGLMDCDERFFGAFQAAILRYEGALEEDPTGTVSHKPLATNSTALRVNALNEGTESNTTISIPLLDSLEPNDESNTKDPDHQFYISYDFYDKDNPDYHRESFYGFHQVQGMNNRVYTPQLNYISMKLPPFPLLSQRNSIKPGLFCNSSTVQGCEDGFCACTHVYQVELGSVVELVIVDKGFTFDANHPFHLHGHNVRVVAMERVGKSVSVETIKSLDRNGRIHRKLDHAPIKDTVTVPDGGYTIVRFHANNPGYWLFHCHIEFHVEVGMALVFKVGEHEEFSPVPEHFPQCGDWTPSDPPETSNVNTTTDTWKRETPKSQDSKENEAINAPVVKDDNAIVKWLSTVLRELNLKSAAPHPVPTLFALAICLCSIAL